MCKTGAVNDCAALEPLINCRFLEVFNCLDMVGVTGSIPVAPTTRSGQKSPLKKYLVLIILTDIGLA